MSKEIKDVSIDSKLYKKFKKSYEYALRMTERELSQSCEGLYHNLNSLQSRSGRV